MAATSTMLQLGTPAPDFTLQEVAEDRPVSLAEVTGSTATVVAFLCRHCPYVKHVQSTFAEIATTYAPRGVGFVGISSNDPQISPEDAPESLAEQKAEVGFDLPYLFDADQSVARAYGAACTPDVFVFDDQLRLAYRGRLDETRPGQGTAHGGDLRAALDALIAGEAPAAEQHPSIGCSIKWSPGNEPDPSDLLKLQGRGDDGAA
ncbi:MAG: thioredoxin family protein [Nitriliruptoraceae bacterium]